LSLTDAALVGAYDRRTVALSIAIAVLGAYVGLDLAERVSPALAERMVQDFGEPTDGALHHALSDCEFEVMRLLGSGKTVGYIAELLSLSDKTMSTYRARILEKLHLETTAQIARYVIENKLID
jgi:DNA-binding NarL/FixJ family response regulator